MNDQPTEFIYKDSRGNITHRIIANISESSEYIQGICTKQNELRTFRKDRVLEYIIDSLSAKSRLIYHIDNNPKPRVITSKPRKHNISCKSEICFTGFNKEDKEILVGIAESRGIFVRSSVTKTLNYLCCGYNAGPSKIEKSRHQGVVILTESQFKLMLETGEIPD